ncbi:hypothetical protein [Nocardia tengchongensis]|uniref:hypothetical protein n=1 Tax=Nocardia tengchongensis TaxID=2055889 RepID=UPI00367BC254
MERLCTKGKLDELTGRFWQERPAEELYDTSADPYEIHNLATGPAFGTDLRRLSAALDEHMLAIVDDGFIPESEAAAGYAARRASGHRPPRQHGHRRRYVRKLSTDKRYVRNVY